MILFGGKQEPSATAEVSTEPVQAADFSRVAPYSELSVQSDFGRELKQAQTEDRSELKPAPGPKKSRLAPEVVAELVLLIGVLAAPPALFLISLFF